MSLEKNPAAVPLNNRWIKMREMVSIGHRRIQTSWQLVGSHFCRQVSSLLNFMLQNSCNYNTAILFTFPDIFVRMLQCLKFLVLIAFKFQPSKPFGFMAQNKREIICIEKYPGPLCRPYLDPELIPRWVLTFFDFGDPKLFITILLITRVSSVASYELQQQTRSKCT
jgi:hypothetical protein